MLDLLYCKNLTKKFANVTALDDVSFVLPRGKIIGLLGPNGSGKTTLIKLISGLLTPTSGEIYVNLKPIGVQTKRVVSYLPDNNYLDDSMTVEQTVVMFCDFFPDFRPDLAYKLLSQLKIDPLSKFKTLSKGNKEKVSLILTMSRDAELYVLDEPIAGVDPATRDYIISTVLNNRKKEASVLISTHLITDIEPILDEVLFIGNRKIIMQKSVQEIRKTENKSVDELFREVFKWQQN